ncbi:MAG: glycosyltransferase involved in cell wall biosynthesis, partial [Planctomycetota bacterium]
RKCALCERAPSAEVLPLQKGAFCESTPSAKELFLLGELTTACQTTAMRICLVAHGFPPEERAGVETYTASLAAGLSRAGHVVEVFAACTNMGTARLAMRRVEVDLEGASYGVTRIAVGGDPAGPKEILDPAGIAARFGAFLEREQSEIVHFQHVIKLGLGLIDVAREAGLPTVYTHHDYYGCCHRYTFLRPDLAVCKTPNDAYACARCDKALGMLNGVEGLGDYQMGVDAASLPKDAQVLLSGLLDGDPVEDGKLDKDEWTEAGHLRYSLDKRRSEVFSRLDLRLSPSKFLQSCLEKAGVGKVEHLVNGIECSDLVGLPSSAPVRAPAPKTPLRILYIGSFVKQKGVEVLLDAFGLLMDAPEAKQRPRAELTVRGYASDEKWVEQLERRGAEVGAELPGGFVRSELPEILAAADVVVVPSTWFENYPTVIREAFAAGRPVVASRIGALEESVQDGVDGLLFEPGNAKDLARVFGQLLDNPSLVPKLADGIGPVHTVEQQVDELVTRYQQLVDAAPTEDFTKVPVHMREFIERNSALEKQTTRQLFQDVLGGLDELGKGLGMTHQDLELNRVLTEGFSGGDEAQRRIRDAEGEAIWLRERLAAADLAEDSFLEKVEWLEQTLDARETAITSLEKDQEELALGQKSALEKGTWLEQTIQGLESAAASNEEQQRAARIAAESQLEELVWLRELKESSEAELKWLHESVANLTEERNSLTVNQEALVRQLAKSQGEEAEFRQRLAEGLKVASDQGLGAVSGIRPSDAQALAPLFQSIGASIHGGSTPEQLLEATDLLVTALGLGLDGAQLAEAELVQRRTEMSALSEDASGTLIRLLIARSAVAKRLQAWRQDGLTGEDQ